jgi:hypothetical protein
MNCAHACGGASRRIDEIHDEGQRAGAEFFRCRCDFKYFTWLHGQEEIGLRVSDGASMNGRGEPSVPAEDCGEEFLHRRVRQREYSRVKYDARRIAIAETQGYALLVTPHGLSKAQGQRFENAQVGLLRLTPLAPTQILQTWTRHPYAQ